MIKRIKLWAARDSRPYWPDLDAAKTRLYAKARPKPHRTEDCGVEGIMYKTGEECPNDPLTLPPGKAKLLNLKPGECKAVYLIIKT